MIRFHNPIIQKPARDSNKGGGLAIYINKNSFDESSFSVIEDISDANAERGEFLFVEINTGVKIKTLS